MEETELDALDRQIIGLWNDNLSGAQVAERLGMSRHSVLGKVYRLRLRGFKLREDHSRHRKHTKRARMPSVPMTHPKGVAVEKPKPLPATKALPAEESLYLTLFQLRLTSCRYIITNERGYENVRYCGAPTKRGSYCRTHAALCYQPPVKRNR